MTEQGIDVDVLPAHAGMIPTDDKTLQRAFSAPRTCGDDPDKVVYEFATKLCSPHMRG